MRVSQSVIERILLYAGWRHQPLLGQWVKEGDNGRLRILTVADCQAAIHPYGLNEFQKGVEQ
jgi:hypothetical protein